MLEKNNASHICMHDRGEVYTYIHIYTSVIHLATHCIVGVGPGRVRGAQIMTSVGWPATNWWRRQASIPRTIPSLKYLSVGPCLRYFHLGSTWPVYNSKRVPWATLFVLFFILPSNP